MKVALLSIVALSILLGSWIYPSVGFPHAATTNTVIFDREIVRILNEHCIMCHIEGGPSFSLATYEDTWLRRDSIHNQILAGHMPPWAAVPGYGEFVNANKLTLAEKRFVVSWVEGLGPRNTGTVFLNVFNPDEASRDEIESQFDVAAWVLGEPDLAMALPATDPATAGGGESSTRVQRAIIDPGLESETWLSALEYQPKHRDTIRAAVFSVEGTSQWLGSWTPWHGFRRLPERTAYRLARGTKIIAEIYTTEVGPAILEPGWIGLHIAEDTSGVAIPFDIVVNATEETSSDGSGRRIHGETQLSADARLLALWPSLPADMQSIEVLATLPDGRVEILLFAIDIPHEWPTPYIFETPVELAVGSRVSFTAVTANSSAQPLEQRIQLRISASRHSPNDD